jgi:hypothetical protein
LGSEREASAVQQADEPDALRRVTPLACASVAPRLARGLSAPLDRQELTGLLFFKPRTAKEASKPASFSWRPIAAPTEPRGACLGAPARGPSGPSKLPAASLALQTGRATRGVGDPLGGFRPCRTRCAVLAPVAAIAFRGSAAPRFHRGAHHAAASLAALVAPESAYTFCRNRRTLGHRRQLVLAWRSRSSWWLSNNALNPSHFAASRRLRAQAARRGSRAG